MQKKLKLQLLPVLLFSTVFIQAQVGIGTSSPDPSAMLQISSKNKGMLLPSIALASSTDQITIPNPAEGLIVWNNGSGALTTSGIYYWSDSKWNMLSTGTGNGSNGGVTPLAAWNNTAMNSGNSGGANTNLALGTNTTDDLVFKVNSIAVGRLGVNNSISFGTAANAAQNGIALGNSSSAYQGIAIGTNTSVTANESVALGANSKISGYQSTAVGFNAKVTVNEATAVGNNADASGFQSIALGYNAKTTTNDATALGKNSTASGFQSTAVGYNAKTTSNSETAIGYNTITNNQNSTAVGSGANALGQFSTALGYGAVTSQANAIVIGNNNANIGIGTGTPNVSAKIDVNGQYKLGEKGSVQKNQISFQTWPSVSVNNLAPGRSVSMEIPIPANMQPGSVRAAIVVSPAGDFAGNTSFSISNPRMTSTSSVTINLTNISGNTESLYSTHFYVMINEF
ncbi:hypothetical protein ACM46_15595 [Chryseobacterium angstadtii]|uniref:Trimeric autotransporter adhesin YadA-like head domain-containing protein n=1 Tax=Chryseobacterium angstadtii TaxID=558151 RepID=A0A0J7I4X6_9FLAO|nr:hypothetical protein [Chryseobacterium angstadtii]KMQ61443.1 hypothetical protein ACM46_15595 [Chryseobacterium angstadtii]